MPRTTWHDFPDTSTPLSAAQLNSLEERKPEVDELWVNIKSLGWQGTGDSIDTYVQEAVTYLGANGGTIFFPPGSGTFSALPSFAGTRNIVLKGSGGLNAGAQAATSLTYTGTGTRAIDARSTQGFQLRDLQLLYSNAAFTGVFVDFSQSTTDAHYGVVDCCYIGGASVAGASALISYNKAICQTVRNCTFGQAVVAIKGINSGSDYSNIISVENCTFLDQTTTSVTNANQAWAFRSCTFEPLVSTAASAYNQATGAAVALSFDGCWFGDANGTGNWITVSGSGLSVKGCYFALAAKAVALGASSFGASIKGNTFVSLTTGIDVGSNCKWVDATANDYQTVTNRVVTADVAPGSMIQTGDMIEIRGVPSVKAFNTSHQNLTTGTSTVLTWDSEVWDTGALHDTGTNPGRLTAVVAGLYLVTALVVWNTGTTGQRGTMIRSNGSATEANDIVDAGGTSPQQTVSAQVKLAAGGYVECVATHAQGADLLVVNGSGLSSFSMTYLGTV